MMEPSLSFSKSALVLIPRLVAMEDRGRMLEAFERHAREARATQIGANHVLEVILGSRYYVKYGEGLQGGPGSGPTDPPRDRQLERAWLMEAPFEPVALPPEPS